MCGIAGIVHIRDSAGAVVLDTLEVLRRELAHRGPDGSDVWRSADGRVGLVHTRLSIIDLSPSGAQPMSTRDGRYTLVFNGEIYNYEELGEPLRERGVQFRGSSDTEVLLELFAEMGPQCLDLLDGMFAFAVWDARERTLFCARDHLGEKPLYYVSSADKFAFSSEVRCLLRGGVVAGTPDIEGLRYLFSQGSIPPPFTHLQEVRFLEPGAWLRLDLADGKLGKQRYWTPPYVAEDQAMQDPLRAVEIVHETLRRSVRRRLRADVPVGAFLSSGMDSSLLVALMKEQGATDLRTFTVALPGHPSDEAGVARTTARLLGTSHTEIPLEVGADASWLDDALGDMDVPSVDGPNTWLVSRAVRQAGAKVACSGLGGDELFYGYPSFSFVPRMARLRLGWLMLHLPEGLRAWIASVLPPVPRFSRMAESILAGASIAALWYAKRSVMSDRELREIFIESAWRGKLWDPIRRIERLGCPKNIATRRQVSFYELAVYLHDQLLRDTDQMSMAHALEVRVPLIGREVVETVAGLGDTALNGKRSKMVLRKILATYLPLDQFHLQKQGFTLNWKSLLRGRPPAPLGLLGSVLRPDRVGQMQAEFQSGRSGFAPHFVVEAATAWFLRFS